MARGDERSAGRVKAVATSATSKDKGKTSSRSSKDVSGGASSSPAKKQRKGEVPSDARQDALDEARDLEAACDNAPTPPPKSPQSGRVSERQKALELNQAREETAKLQEELERMKEKYEKEKRKSTVTHAPPPPPRPPRPPAPTPTRKARVAAAVSRRRQVRNHKSIFMPYDSYS